MGIWKVRAVSFRPATHAVALKARRHPDRHIVTSSQRYRSRAADQERLAEAKIIFVTMHAGLTDLQTALHFRRFRVSPQEVCGNGLLKAVREVLAGRTYLAPELATMLPGLTASQVKAIRLIGNGQANDEIAASLDITVRTVRFHRSEIARKLASRARRRRPNTPAETASSAAELAFAASHKEFSWSWPMVQ